MPRPKIAIRVGRFAMVASQIMDLSNYVKRIFL